MFITNVEYALFAARSNNNQISRQIKKAGVHCTPAAWIQTVVLVKFA